MTLPAEQKSIFLLNMLSVDYIHVHYIKCEICFVLHLCAFFLWLIYFTVKAAKSNRLSCREAVK